MVFLELGLVSLLLAYVFYKWATLKYNTFKERGVPYEEPWPLVGNAGAVVLNKQAFNTNILRFYERNRNQYDLSAETGIEYPSQAHYFSNGDIVGYYHFRSPVYVIQNPEYIKKITVKDFDYFVNHTPFFVADDDPIINGTLTVMKDQRWRDMRNTLIPIYTSAKVSAMFSLMNECFNDNLNRLREKTKGGSSHDVELKGWFVRLSTDLMAATAFGYKVNSYVNEKNEFFTYGQSISSFSGMQVVRFFFAIAMPAVQQFLGFKTFDGKNTDNFKRLVFDTMKYRQENKIYLLDMIQLLMEAKEDRSQNWSDDEIFAQCFIYFFASYENNANLAAVMCHELMENPDVQQRLYEEVMEVHDELKGAPLTYEAVTKMKYLDMVTSEALRKWSIPGIIDRICAKDYDLKDADGNLIFKFKAGDYIWFPMIGMHYDEKYFDDPYSFNPERFSDVNKNNINPYTYFPFGVGPRMCIGYRYTLAQVKATLYYMILEFKFERSAKTVSNILEDLRGFQIRPNGGFWVRLVPRK